MIPKSGAGHRWQLQPADNRITEEDAEGNTHICFVPVYAWETPKAMERLCQAYNNLCNSGQYNPLLMIPVFIPTFLCIHPFNEEK